MHVGSDDLDDFLYDWVTTLEEEVVKDFFSVLSDEVADEGVDEALRRSFDTGEVDDDLFSPFKGWCDDFCPELLGGVLVLRKGVRGRPYMNRGFLVRFRSLMLSV